MEYRACGLVAVMFSCYERTEVVLSDEELVFKEKLDFLFNVINRYDHYIGTTNFKVGLMMSFVGAVVLGLTMRVMLIAAPKEECGVLYYFAIFSSLSTIVLSLLAAVNLLRVVFPNTNTHGGKKIINIIWRCS